MSRQIPIPHFVFELIPACPLTKPREAVCTRSARMEVTDFSSNPAYPATEFGYLPVIAHSFVRDDPSQFGVSQSSSETCDAGGQNAVSNQAAVNCASAPYLFANGRDGVRSGVADAGAADGVADGDADIGAAGRMSDDWPAPPIDDERAQFLHDLYRDEECDR